MSKEEKAEADAKKKEEAAAKKAEADAAKAAAKEAAAAKKAEKKEAPPKVKAEKKEAPSKEEKAAEAAKKKEEAEAKKAEKAAEAAKKKEEAEAKKAEKAASKGEKKEAPSKEEKAAEAAKKKEEADAKKAEKAAEAAKKKEEAEAKKAAAKEAKEAKGETDDAPKGGMGGMAGRMAKKAMEKAEEAAKKAAEKAAEAAKKAADKAAEHAENRSLAALSGTGLSLPKTPFSGKKKKDADADEPALADERLPPPQPAAATAPKLTAEKKAEQDKAATTLQARHRGNTTRKNRKAGATTTSSQPPPPIASQPTVTINAPDPTPRVEPKAKRESTRKARDSLQTMEADLKKKKKDLEAADNAATVVDKSPEAKLEKAVAKLGPDGADITSAPGSYAASPLGHAKIASLVDVFSGETLTNAQIADFSKMLGVETAAFEAAAKKLEETEAEIAKADGEVKEAEKDVKKLTEEISKLEKAEPEPPELSGKKDDLAEAEKKKKEAEKKMRGFVDQKPRLEKALAPLLAKVTEQVTPSLEELMPNVPALLRKGDIKAIDKKAKADLARGLARLKQQKQFVERAKDAKDAFIKAEAARDEAKKEYEVARESELEDHRIEVASSIATEQGERTGTFVCTGIQGTPPWMYSGGFGADKNPLEDADKSGHSTLVVRHGAGVQETMVAPPPGGVVEKAKARYEGDWRVDQMHGAGAFSYAHGLIEKYVGGYKNGKKHGQGTMTTRDGYVMKGSWKDGKLHGWFTLESLEENARNEPALKISVEYENDIRISASIERSSKPVASESKGSWIGRMAPTGWGPGA